MRDSDLDYTKCSILELSGLYQSKQVTPTEVLDTYLARIKQLNGPFKQYKTTRSYNAIVQLFEVEARAQASQADKRFAQWDRDSDPVPPLLCGVPIAVKENIEIKGHECVMAAPDLFAGNIADQDATVIAKLREQGAVIVGYAIASRLTQNTAGMFAGNAWDVARSPGGSSQGSGVAPLIRFCVAALGGETGGSITIPASANGASAIKPSSGLISMAGVMPMQPGVDVVGPMARSMQDAAILMNAVMGVDSRDSQTREAPVPARPLPIYPRIGSQPLKGTKIGVPQRDWMYPPGKGTPPYDAYSEDYRQAFVRLKDELTSLGAEMVNFRGLDIDDEEDNPYYGGRELRTVVIDWPPHGPTQFYITAEQGSVYPNFIEWGIFDEIRRFADTRPDEQKAKLLSAMIGAKGPVAEYLISDPEARAEAGERLLRLRSNYEAALAAENLDFMLFLELGDYPRDKHLPSRLDLPISRSYFALENAMGWPVATFPIGHGKATGTTLADLPISASFWGPRFSDHILVQAILDYQDRFGYHLKLPHDARQPVG